MQKGTIALTVALAMLAVAVADSPAAQEPNQVAKASKKTPVKPFGASPLASNGSRKPLPPRLTAKRLVEMADKNWDSKLTFEEYQDFTLKYHKYNLLEYEFDNFDDDSNGLLTVKEIDRAMKLIDREVPSQINEALDGLTSARFIEEADSNNDDKLSIMEAYVYLSIQNFDNLPVTLTRFDVIRDGVLSTRELDAARNDD